MCVSTVNNGLSTQSAAIPVDIPNYHGHGLTEPVMNSSGTLYFCCVCNDGPKLYSLQPKCVMCNHVICSGCRPAK